MAYFTDFQDYFFLCSDISPEEKRKLNDYLRILEDSGVGEIIAEAVDKAPEKAVGHLTTPIACLPPCCMRFPNIPAVSD